MSAESSRAVFLSYASQDAQAARRVCDALRAAGVEVWFDQSELRGGDAWDQNIRKQIKECALFLPIISANTQARHEGYFRLEWRLADHRTHLMGKSRAFLLPVCIDDTRDTHADVPDSFVAVQWMRLPNGEAPATFCERVKALLGISLESRASPPAPHGNGDGALSSNVPVAGGTPAVSRKFVLRWIVGGIVGAGGIAALAIWQPWKSAARMAPTPAHAAMPPAKELSEAVPEGKSVAVLAFKNLSDDKGSEYFSDGISEELANVLGRVPGLRVAGSTSAFSFKGKAVPVPEIARQLGVSHVVEGTVRRDGNRVRIMAKLLNAADGFQVWASENLDREVKDSLAVQDEIAGLIAKSLSLKLGASTPAATATVNPEAFRLYLEAREAWSQRGSDTDAELEFRKAESLLDRAIALDQNFGRAHGTLAVLLARRYGMLSYRAPGDPLLARRVRAAAEKALALDPNLAEAHTALARLLYQEQHFDAAAVAYHRAIAANPNYGTAHHWHGVNLMSQGNIETGLAELQIATWLDPLAPIVFSNYASFLASARRWEEALVAADRALVLLPNYNRAVTTRMRALIGLGRRAEALAVTRLEIEKRQTGDVPNLVILLAEAGDPVAAAKLAEPILENQRGGSIESITTFRLYLALNRVEDGFRYLERADFSGMRGAAFLDPLFDRVRDDPRLIRKLEAAGIHAGYQLAWEQYVAWKKKTGQP
jgi:TolB-like protein/Tfp pilus assembly protein PilF